MYTHILVPVSFDQDRDAAGAMHVAEVLAEKDAKITLLHVIEQIPGYAASYLPKDYTAERKAAITKEIEDLAAGMTHATGAVVSGHAGRTILDYAQDHGADCIVIASHRPGMQDLLLGSTAHFVVRHAPCAVHVVR